MLEWLAFGSALLATFAYGRSVKLGAAIGLFSSVMFLWWSLLGDHYGALTVNGAFAVIHILNFRRGERT